MYCVAYIAYFFSYYYKISWPAFICIVISWIVWVISQYDNRCLNDKNIGILILTEKVFDLLHDEVMQVKVKSKFPLIVEIPDRFGLKKDEDFITKHINESIGVNI